jgi:16S rRNA (uracil1498-N3)-methyltransferase
LPLFVESQPQAGIIAGREGCSIGTVSRGIGALLVVGPEGGFSEEERELFSRLEWPLVRFGPHVLRTETAAVVGAAMMVAREELRWNDRLIRE